jgi:hypothetical protein
MPDMQSVQHDSVKTTLLERQHFLELLKQNLSRVQNIMKIDADSKRSERSFQVGEMILLKLQPYAQSLVINRPCPKLAMKYFGPYQVMEKIREAAYKLYLPEHSQVHPVFHVSQIKPYTVDYAPVFQPSSSLPQLDLLDLEPEAVLDRRLSKKGNSTVVQVLVKWSSLPLEMAT